MNKYKIVNTETGEELVVKGLLMVAPNGMVFVKDGKSVVWASGALHFVVTQEG